MRDEETLSPEMVTVAQHEESFSGPRGQRRDDEERMVGEYDTSVHIKLTQEYDKFMGGSLKDTMKIMEDSVNVDNIVKELEDKLDANQSSWRSLLNAFDTRLAGTYKVLASELF